MKIRSFNRQLFSLSKFICGDNYVLDVDEMDLGEVMCLMAMISEHAGVKYLSQFVLPSLIFRRVQ